LHQFALGRYQPCSKILPFPLISYTSLFHGEFEYCQEKLYAAKKKQITGKNTEETSGFKLGLQISL